MSSTETTFSTEMPSPASHDMVPLSIVTRLLLGEMQIGTSQDNKATTGVENLIMTMWVTAGNYDSCRILVFKRIMFTELHLTSCSLVAGVLPRRRSDLSALHIWLTTIAAVRRTPEALLTIWRGIK